MRFHTLDEWLTWLESGQSARIELGLGRVAHVLQRMEQHAFDCPIITVAGTNGKGSCVALLEAILGAAGYRVGAYTSPHLLKYNERVRVGGVAVTDEALCEAFARVDAARGDHELTYFEFGTLAAIALFARTAPDVVILEVGLGGRLDACNVLDADVALVTRIGLDHQDWLGEDRESIAIEKAGIFQAGRPAVCGDPEPPASVEAEARRIGATLSQSGDHFRFSLEPDGWWWWSDTQTYASLPLPKLQGAHQVANAAAVLMALELLSEDLPVAEGAIRKGLMETALPGRFQVIADEPELILDVAHNPQAATALAEQLRSRPCAGQTHAILGMLDDKDIEGFVAELDAFVDHWYLAGLSVPRGLSAVSLAQRLREAGYRSLSESKGVVDAFECLKRRAAPQDRILVCGSFYTVAELLPRHV